MLTETRRYFKWSRTGSGVLDKAGSIPKREVPDKMANEMMKLLAYADYKRHETPTQIFFDKVWNCHESEEVIFYK